MADEEVDEGGGGGGGKKKLIMIIIVVLILLVGGGVGAFLFLGGEDEEAAAAAKGAPETKLEEEIQQTSQTEMVKLENPVFTPPKKYTVNLRDGKHFLSLTLVAVLEDPNALLFLAGREPLIDDMVVSFLQDLTTEDLRTRAGTELVKREIYKKINSVFTSAFVEESETKDRTPVKKVLITNFILN